MPKAYTFDVYHSGEVGAGIRGFSDRVFVTVESGDPGGDEKGKDSFSEFMREALSEWFDGASVNEVTP